MYLDILAQDNYGTYHRKLARLTNIITAVYWSELLDIITKVIKKKKFDENGFFKVDRKYIEERTTLTVELQLEAESILNRLEVLNRSETDSDMISVNLETMTKILTDNDIKKLDKVEKLASKVSRSQKAADKKAGIIITMKRCLSEQDQDLRNLFENWVDSVYESGRFLTKAKITIFENRLSDLPKQDKQEILKLGIQTGWTDPDWLINKFNSQHNTGSKINKEQKTSSGVKEDISF